MQALQVELRRGEELYAEAGTMLYMGPGIDLQAKMQGGVVKGLMRKFLAGESMFMSVFRCETASARLALANPIAGKIFPVELKGNTVLAERNASTSYDGEQPKTNPACSLHINVRRESPHEFYQILICQISIE